VGIWGVLWPCSSHPSRCRPPWITQDVKGSRSVRVRPKEWRALDLHWKQNIFTRLTGKENPEGELGTPEIFSRRNIGWDGGEDGKNRAILPYVLGDDLAGAVRQVEVEKISEERHGGDELTVVAAVSSSSPDEGPARRCSNGSAPLWGEMQSECVSM
jgi:hypothetical protein